MEIKRILKNIKLHESSISMILGAVVIIVTGILIVNYFDSKKGDTITPLFTENIINLPTTHKISQGEDLWKIAEKYYGSGYNWVDIANENNISNPNQIKSGDIINIPDVQIRKAESIVPISSAVEASSPTLSVEKDKPTIAKNTHKVIKGENLWLIAEKYYGSGYNWVDIAKENNLSSLGEIEVDQELIIPDVETKSITTTTYEIAEPINGSTYTVIRGDSLWLISLRAYGDAYKWIEIAKENHLENPGIIHPGNTLILPR